MSVRSIQTVSLWGFKTIGDQYLNFDENVNAILGANASGKSMLLRAIKYCLNDKEDNEIASPESSITVQFKLSDGTERSFRKNTGDVDEEEFKPFEIDGEGVSAVTYLAELEDIGITSHRLYFLIPGFAWGSVPDLTSSKLAELIENLSPDGAALRDEFNLVKGRLRRAQGISRAQLEDDFKDIKSRRQDTFMKSFNSIAEIIDEFFKIATTKPSWSAQLDIVNKYEAYKRVKFVVSTEYVTIETISLSGGEKKFVSVAFIFACQAALQTPFVLLNKFDYSFFKFSCRMVAEGLKEIIAKTNLQINVVCLEQGKLSDLVEQKVMIVK